MEHFNHPVIVTNYPKNNRPFYMRLNEDAGRRGDSDLEGLTVANFDLLMPGRFRGGWRKSSRGAS